MAGVQGGTGMNNLTTLIKRLEAATSRLEDIASSAEPFDSSHPPASRRGTSAGTALPSGDPQQRSNRGSDVTMKETLPPAIKEMDTLLETEVKAFTSASQVLDTAVAEQASLVAKAFVEQRRFLLTSTRAKKPDMQSKAFMDILQDLQQDMSSVGDVRDSHRGSPMKEHFSMVGEGITALQWLVMDGKPADFVSEVIGGAQMYGNRILKNYKEGEQSHVKYVQAYYALLKSLLAYIKKHYPSGLTWHNNGQADALAVYRDIGTASTNKASAPVVQTGTFGGAPPPPPPPPPLPNFDNVPSAPSGSQGSGSDMGAVFQQLNRGEGVTAGLKKVDKSQMTHKNPSLRASSTVPERGDSRNRSPGPQIKPKPPSMRQNSTNSGSASTTPNITASKPRRDPKKELDGNKWLVENFDSPSRPVELEVSLSQSVLVTNCRATTLILRGKANAVSIDNSPRTQMLVDTLVSSIDVIKCPGFAVQVTGSVPTIMLDQVDGASVYLGPDSLDTEVFTSKCSSVNVILTPARDDQDSVECPLPEQMVSRVRGDKVVSEIVEHAG